MPVELNQFTESVGGGRFALADNVSGNPVIVEAQFSFSDKVMHWLSQMPLLNNLAAVQEFAQKQTESNLKTLGVFLNALSHERGEEYALKVANKMDYSGQTPLTSRLIEHVTQGITESQSITVSAQEHIESEPKEAETKPQLSSTSLSELEQAVKPLSNYSCPVALPLPSSLSYISSFLYSETESMQHLQHLVADYNQAITDSSFNDAINDLTEIFQTPLSSEKMTETLTFFAERIQTLNDKLSDIQSAVDGLPEHQHSDAIQLNETLATEIKQLKRVDSFVSQYKVAWKAESADYATYQQFHENCSQNLKSSLSPELTKLSFELIHDSPSLDSEVLANRLAKKLGQYTADMSTVNWRVLSEVLAEKVPSLADEVQTPFNTKEQKAQFGALNLIRQALSQSREKLHEEKEGIEARLDIPNKITQLRHIAAVFTKEVEQFQNTDPTAEYQFEATLAAITGNTWSVVKGDKLLPDGVVDYKDLDLTEPVENDLASLDISERARGLAEKVIQTQHRFAWLDATNSTTYEPNNRSGVDIFKDIRNKQLADNITQNLPSYVDYLDQKVTAAKAYVASLNTFIEENVCDSVTHQAQGMFKEAEKQLFRLESLDAQCQLVQKALDTREAVGNRLADLKSMLHRTIDTDVKRLNLQGFLSYLPALRDNNDQVRALVAERQNLQTKLKSEEQFLIDLQGKDWRKNNELSTKPEALEYQYTEKKLAELDNLIEHLDNDYEKSMLELTRFDRIVNSGKGYPDISGNSMESWSAWVKQNIAGSWSGDYRPDFNGLILDRQMAKAGINSYTEAYQKLASTLLNGKNTSNYEEATKALRDVHNWAMAHPVESQALAENLTHVYQIISANSGWFGPDLVAMASTVWQTATVENQVKDILQGRREFIPSQNSMSMTAEMIALLHLAQCAPYMVGAAKGATGNGLIASMASTMVSSFAPAPAASLARPMAGMLGGIVQTWTEQKLTNAVVQNRSTEVMVNALMKGIQQQGGFSDRAKAVTSYMMQRQDLQNIGTLATDCFETNKMGVVRRMWQDAKNSWHEMDWKAKAFTLVTTATVVAGTAVTATAVVLAIAGTGGGAIAAAAIVGAAVMPLGAYMARAVLNRFSSTNFLGLNDAQENAKEKMTQQRIDDALNRLESKMKDDQRKGDVIRHSLQEIGELIQLNHLPEDQWERSFIQQVRSITSERRQEIDKESARSKAELIKMAQAFMPESITNKDDDWDKHSQQVDDALVKFAA